MQLQKFRWSKVYESSEEELTDFLESRNIIAERYAVDEFEEFSGSFEYDVTFWCAEGSFKMQINEINYSMQPGDALRIPANNAYQATAGISGCSWYVSSNVR